MMDLADVVGVVSLVILGGTLCLVVGCEAGISEEKRAAIKAGVAHYEVNPTTGKTTFVYGVPKVAPAK